MNGRIVRTFGVGLLVSAWLANHFQMMYLRWVGETSLPYSFQLAITQMAGKSAAETLGIGGYLIATYLMACLGAGMVVSGFLWPLLDDTLIFVLSLPGWLVVQGMKKIGLLDSGGGLGGYAGAIGPCVPKE